MPKVDIVFHLAAVSGYKNSSENVNLAFKINVLGTANVLEYCRRVGAKLVFASTYVYDQPYNEVKDESSQTNPTTTYSFTKFLGEELCRFYSRIFKVNTLILRTSNVYGPGQDEIYIVPVIAKHIYNEIPLSLTRPEVERSFIYIDDLVEAYIKLAEAKTRPGKVFNVGPNKSTALDKLVTTLKTILKKNSKIIYSGKDRPQEADINRINNQKMIKAINWEPKIGLTKGLTKYCDWLVGKLK